MKIFFSFIQDRKEFVIGYFINCILITVFFYLYTGKAVEIIYPFSISILIFITILLIQWLKNYKFLGNIDSHAGEPFYNLQPITYEHKKYSESINGIHNLYLNKINELQKVNQDRNRFFSHWVHNIKTPVSIIDVIVQKALSSNEIEKAMIKDIKKENALILEGLEQILGIVRLGEYQNDFCAETIDILADIRKLINLKKSDFIYNNVFPEIDCKDEKVFVITDSKWNRLLMEQVVSNAIKYSKKPDESKKIFFEINSEKEYTKLSIRDQGIGIPKYELDRVIKPFYTGENGREFRDSTGIGLYICSEIARILGHKLEINSEEGKGSTVTITYLTKT